MRGRFGMQRNVMSPYPTMSSVNGYSAQMFPQSVYHPNHVPQLHSYMHPSQPLHATGLPYQPQMHPQSYGQQPNAYNDAYAPYANTSLKQPLSPSHLLQNPLQQAQQSSPNPYHNQSNMMQQYVNPYPKHAMFQKQKPAGSILNSFKGQDGSIDINKMMNTAGQMMNAVNQVSSMVKGLGSMFKV
ncbi:YppG family protein [Bacillus carboniphilus]|uniref:YppG family protein n=1 Tax=Bacillus carboniphilus TaxID=86663 RepID=A0ABP3GKJ2_9BACI